MAEVTLTCDDCGTDATIENLDGWALYRDSSSGVIYYKTCGCTGGEVPTPVREVKFYVNG